MHTITIDDLVLCAQDGLMLGNGDLSVSIYQRQSEIVWRFGKNDVWDRRHMLEDNPSPATMEEIRTGIANEGWCSPAYGGEVHALKGTKNPKRTLEILSNPPSEAYPYPMPKPVGELALHWPPDLQKMSITQTLIIEEGRVEINCDWPDGEKLVINSFVHPTLNVLVVKWCFSDWHSGSPQPFFKTMPLWLSLYRWADPSIEEFAMNWMSEYMCPMFIGFNKKSTPLPPPRVVNQSSTPVIEQHFYPDTTFPQGFKYWLGCITDQSNIQPVDTGILKQAKLLISPVSAMTPEDVAEFMTVDQQLRDGTLRYPDTQDYSGWIAVPVATSSDEGGPEREFAKIYKLLNTKDISVLEKWQEECVNHARTFWSASTISINEPIIEKLWYAALHISRCIYRKDSVCPGLFIPSTINDYSLWHGDYHTNYNLQQCFWGLLTANHPELNEAYFNAVDYLNQIGKKIARDYCGTRGTFIQITGYPIEAKDDPIGTGCMGRMPYMTGWVPEGFWLHYLYTHDTDFLKSRAYPFIKDCALFYTDFLHKGSDNLYHAFPSCWGEEGYDGNMQKNLDALQTIEYARSSMNMAIEAAKALNVDIELQREWQERIDHLAYGQGESEWRQLPQSNEDRHKKFNLPAFRPGENYRFPNKWRLAQRWWGWIDKFTISWIRDVRGGQFLPDRDFADLLKVLHRWCHSNGLLWPMPIRYYGNAGAWTEILGIIEPLQEMMIQSWDKVIKIFPAWPSRIAASFYQLRAEGAFLVSAKYDGFEVTEIIIKSLAGNTCSLGNPRTLAKIQIIDLSTEKIVAEGASEIISFETKAQTEYKVVFA